MNSFKVLGISNFCQFTSVIPQGLVLMAFTNLITRSRSRGKGSGSFEVGEASLSPFYLSAIGVALLVVRGRTDIRASLEEKAEAA